MPDSLRVELAERTVICPEASVELVSTESVADASTFWNDSLNNACGIMFTPAESTTTGIEITDHSDLKCEAFLKVPVALDAAVITFVLGENYELTFDAPTLAKIFSGEITQWNDPAIVALNEYAILGQEPIILPTSALGPARDALEFWLEGETASEVDLSFIEDSGALESESLYSMGEGEIRITAFSSTLTTGYPVANIATVPGDLNTVIVPDARLIQTAGTQVEVVRDDEANSVSIQFNRENEAKPLLGAVDPLIPYAPVYSIQMGLCGEDTVDLRNTGRYLLRLDAQGVIETGVTSPLPEHVRVAAAALIDSGNPSIEAITEVSE
jgi:hypothetical protein